MTHDTSISQLVNWSIGEKDMTLSGRVAVVTGATSEIGHATALRLATLEDCAAAMIHLAAPDMRYVTGQILYVEGGFLSAGVLAKQ